MRLSASPLVKPLLTFLSSLVLLRAFAMDSLFRTNTQPTGTSPATSASSAWADSSANLDKIDLGAYHGHRHTHPLEMGCISHHQAGAS